MRLNSLLLFALVAFAPLRAASVSQYLPPNQPDAVVLLAPPPVAGSPEDRVDLETSYAVASAATPAEVALAKAEGKLTIFHFAPAIGPWFQPGKFPQLEALFRQVEVEAKAVTTKGKKHWQRLRPYHVDPVRFPHAIEHEQPTDFGYPSGHSTRGTTFALLLAELFPSQRAAILAKGHEAGWLRVQGGVHYPTDIYAGRVLGQALAREFLASPSFQHDLAAVKAELAAAAPH
ncbi:MAG: phosphatase PAP2 family protein [Opitutales bacterium]|nr:phosphatase PAP2 family protein [Opitutales bacterium]